ncbi:MAG: adenine-specific methyltransferase EcoRI family protein, partial [Lutibacter sp.]
VGKVAEIPMDYKGAMGVPITFLDKYNPNQFEILSSNDLRLNDNVPFKEHGLIKDKDGTINGVPTYVRIVIRNKKL